MILHENRYLKAPSTRLAGEYDFMAIDAQRRYIVTATTAMLAPRKVIPIPVHYVELADGAMRVRLARSEIWLTHACREEARGLTWTIEGKDSLWEDVAPTDVPDWAQSAFSRGFAALQKFPA